MAKAKRKIIQIVVYAQELYALTDTGEVWRTYKGKWKQCEGLPDSAAQSPCARCNTPNATETDGGLCDYCIEAC